MFKDFVKVKKKLQDKPQFDQVLILLLRDWLQRRELNTEPRWWSDGDDGGDGGDDGDDGGDGDYIRRLREEFPDRVIASYSVMPSPKVLQEEED